MRENIKLNNFPCDEELDQLLTAILHFEKQSNLSAQLHSLNCPAAYFEEHRAAKHNVKQFLFKIHCKKTTTTSTTTTTTTTVPRAER